MLDIFIGKEKKRAAFLTQWRPIIESSKTAIPNNLPSLPKNKALFFIEEWNSQHSAASENEKIGLAVLANQVEIHLYAKGMLIDGKETVRLMGIQLLGHMRDETLWPILCSLASQNENSIISRAAYEALFKINSRRAFDEVMLTLIRRTDWPLEEVLNTLDNLDGVDVCYFLAQLASDEKYNHEKLANFQEKYDCK